MERTLFRNATIWDGTGGPSFPGDVLVEGHRIRMVARQPGQISADGAHVIDAEGLTLMPGMTEGHAHLSFHGAVNTYDLGDIPPEEHTLITARNAKILLDHGFTSAYSAASAKLRLDIVIRDAIEAGDIPGPRLRASSPEITVTGGLGDERRQHMDRSSFAIVADGVDEIVRTVRVCCRERTDNIKLNISGDDFVASAKGGATVMRETEVMAAVEVAHDFGKMVNSHSRAGNSIKRAVRCGVDVIYHSEHADEEALDMLEAAKDRIFVGPAIGLIHNTLYEAEAFGITHEKALQLGMHRVIENAQRTFSELRKRGVRALIGGDYGFAWVPQGTNARDLQHFVNLLGYSPAEALLCATRNGAAVMGKAHELGQVREGFLADLLLVNGDPVKDVSIIVDAANLVVVMKDGALYKDASASLPRRHAVAAE